MRSATAFRLSKSSERAFARSLCVSLAGAREAYITGITSKSSPANFEDSSSSDMMFGREDSGGNESTRDKIGSSSEKAEVFSSFCSRRDLSQSRSDIQLYSPLPSSRVYHDVRMAVLPDMGISNKASSPACDPPACSPFQRLMPISPDPPIRPLVAISKQKTK